MRSPEFVRIRDCACPGTPHEEGDGVYLAPSLPAEGGIAAEQAMIGVKDIEALTSKWLIIFVRHGATGWNFLDDDGPVPFDVEELLADWVLARPVALRAGDLYQAAVAAPFTPAPRKPSGNGRTRATTSPRRLRTHSPSVSQ